jgi:hypothetical protein
VARSLWTFYKKEKLPGKVSHFCVKSGSPSNPSFLKYLLYRRVTKKILSAQKTAQPLQKGRKEKQSIANRNRRACLRRGQYQPKETSQ